MEDGAWWGNSPFALRWEDEMEGKQALRTLSGGQRQSPPFTPGGEKMEAPFTLPQRGNPAPGPFTP